MSSIGDTHHHPMPRRNIFMFRQFFFHLAEFRGLTWKSGLLMRRLAVPR